MKFSFVFFLIKQGRRKTDLPRGALFYDAIRADKFVKNSVLGRHNQLKLLNMSLAGRLKSDFLRFYQG